MKNQTIFADVTNPMPPAQIFAMANALTRCPALADALAFIENVRKNPDIPSENAGHGLLFSTAQLPGLALEKWAPYGLLLKLPDAFEEDAAEMAANGPQIENVCTMDMLHKLTVGSWHTADKCVSISVDVLYDLANYCHPYDFEHYRRPVVRLPIVIVAGNTVAIGIYATHEHWDLELQSAAIGSGSNWNPWRLYDEETMSVAQQRAQQFGQMPWVGRLFQYPYDDLPEVSTNQNVWLSAHSWFKPLTMLSD